MAQLIIKETLGVLRAISEVIEYYESQQKGLGVRFLHSYDAKLETLKEMPKIGRNGRVFGTKEIVMQDFPFLLVYRIRKEYLEIVRVIHQSMKYPN